MTKRLAFATLLCALASPASAAPPVPKGAHPRLFLDDATRTALKTQIANGSSGAARAIALCKRVSSEPAAFEKSGYQGDTWAFALSACALSWQLTHDATYATNAIRLWRAALADVERIGDGQACVPGAKEPRATAAIRRDSGYAIRFLGPHAALAYDWLHDAPGVDEALRAQSRACFGAWIHWYDQSGYLNDVPGANYHAGYVAAKTLIAVAEAGEDGATSDRMWRDAVDEIFGKQIVNDGLSPQLHKGALVGGDWAEGWQYGPLSVLHYALAARALEEQGVKLPAVDAWANDLTIRFAHGLLPSRDGMYVGGDTQTDTAYLPPNARVLAATLAGPGSGDALGFAAFLRKTTAHEADPAPVLDALADARAAQPIDPAAHLPRFYVARGTRTVYARSSFAADAAWAVFTSAPRVVNDHQHVDASNFVLSRGRDALIVDPSPYGSRSTLTGNAVAVDSKVSNPEYRPSQTPWSEADLSFVRGTKSGVVVARGDFAKAYVFASTPSDVPFAVRDWVFLPEGEVVVVDRTRTDAPERKTYLRFRTPAKLSLANGVAKGTVGASRVAIHAVKLSSGVPSVASIPARDDCEGVPFGSCTRARFPVDEWRVELSGPRATTVHVIDALSADEPEPDVRSIDDAAIASAHENDAVVGAVIDRGVPTFVVATSAKDGGTGTFTYVAPAEKTSRHVVLDAPADANGRCTVVSTSLPNGHCSVTVTAGGALDARPLLFSLTRDGDACAIRDIDFANAQTMSPRETNDRAPIRDAGVESGGCGCGRPRARTAAAAIFPIISLIGTWRKRKNRKTTRSA